jgi:UrcA family protein
MFNRSFPVSPRATLGAASIACALFAGNVAAEDLTIALHVSTQGLNLSQPADAQTFYKRLKDAARVVCTDGNRVGLVPLDNPKGCIDQALATAIRSVKAPMLTRIYLENHMAQGAESGWSYVTVPLPKAAE